MIWSGLAESWPSMCGSATTTIVVSTICMIAAVMITAVIQARP